MATLYTQSTSGSQPAKIQNSAHDTQFYLETGRRFLKDKHFPEASFAFKHITKPISDPALLLLFAQAYRGSGQWKEAEECLMKALRLKPAYYEAHYLLGVIRQEKMVLERSINLHRKMVQENPTDPKAYYFLGSDLLHRGLWQEAITEFQKAIELRPDYADAYFQLGIIYSRGENVDWAIREFDKCLEIQPDFVDTGIQLTLLFFKKKEYAEAAKRLKKILISHPRHPELNFYMGECYRHEGRWKDAVIAYKTAVEIKNDYPEAWSNLALAYLHTSQWEDAQNTAQAALKLKPKDLRCIYVIGCCALMRNQIITAHTYFQQYLLSAEDSFEKDKVRFYLSEMEKGNVPKVI